MQEGTSSASALHVHHLTPSTHGVVRAVPQVIEQINLPSQNRTNSFNYSSSLPDPTICTGTHSVGYSNISQQ